MKISTKLVFLTAGLLLAIVSIEATLRLYYFWGERNLYTLSPQRTTIVWNDDLVVGRRLVPNQKGWFVTQSKEYSTKININSNGWRDSEHSFKKPSNTYRILIIGDSFVENFQVPFENTFSEQLESDLNKKINTTNCRSDNKQSETELKSSAVNKLPIQVPDYVELVCDKKFEIIAIGLGDTGTAQQYLALEKWGTKYNPDLVIQMFFTGNDVVNNSLDLMKDPYRPYFKIENDKLILQPFSSRSASNIQKAKSLIKNNVRLVELILRAKSRISKTYLDIDYPTDYHVYDTDYSSAWKESWSVTEKLILKSKNLSNLTGAQYILISSANNEQVHPNVWEQILQTYPAMNSENLDLDKPDIVLNEFCTSNNLRCYFMLPFFKDYTSQNTSTVTHHPKDGHWNQIGTDLVARFLFKIVNENYVSENNITQ